MTCTWAYAVTTCVERLHTLLPQTLASLAAAGFSDPHLFVDGCNSYQTHLQCTFRLPRLRTAGNWFLGLWELYFRSPCADRYAMFQDDLIMCQGVREYLSRKWPGRGYLNLYTMAGNVDEVKGKPEGWHESNQRGRGAVALAFDRDSVQALLSARHIVIRTPNAHRGWRCIDGGIIQAMSEAGFKEYVHNPSLTQHLGMVSSMGNHPPHPQSPIFPGEDFNVLNLTNPQTEVK